MEFRSTQSRRVHFQGDVVTNVSSGGVENSSHGVHLTGGSTGGIVTAAGDETNIALNVLGKGSGAVNIGNSSSPVVLSSGATLQVGSTAPFQGFIRAVSSFATPNFNTTNIMVMETTHTVTGVSSLTPGTIGPFVYIQGHNLSTDCSPVGAWVGSTANQVHVRFIKASSVTVAAATATMQFLITRFG